jgi:pimeloyl-ACP methyl ester carboxylesterase
MPTDLSAGKKSRARLAEDGRRALIFVHGFGGASTGTWDLFSSLLPEEPLFSRHDLFFYGYESLRQTTAYSAAKFLEWLKEILVDPSTVVNSLLCPSAPRRPPDFTYEQVTIIAHSMGAVVTRRALLDLASDAVMSSPLDRVRMVLFAPAHLGGDVIRLAAEALVPLKLALVVPFLKFRWPSLKDLEPGSITLDLLREDTLRAIEESRAIHGSTRHLIAAAVIHGQKDRIVNQNQFCLDPRLTPFDGRGHIGVCKPCVDFRKPIEVLLPHI